MKSTIITFFVSGFLFSLNATENKSSKKKETVYSDLLSRFDCVLGPNVNNPQWVCNEKAPKGWAKYYGNKLKIEKGNRKQLVNK